MLQEMAASIFSMAFMPPNDKSIKLLFYKIWSDALYERSLTQNTWVSTLLKGPHTWLKKTFFNFINALIDGM